MTECPPVMRRLCHAGVSEMMLSEDDILFSQGEVPSCAKMLFVCEGTLSYTTDGQRFHAVAGGEWGCEQVLWTDCWVYRGLLRASSDCQLTLLDAETFQRLAGNCKSPEFD